MDEEYSLSDELNRKSGEAVRWMENELRRGSITRFESIMALQMFDMATLGLIDPALSKWSNDERGKALLIKPDKVVMHRFEANGVETIVSVELKRHAGCVVVTQLTRNPDFTSKTHTFDDETDPIIAAVKGYRDIVERLQSKGLVVVA